jgi:amino acid adenylation domain-containing protein
MESNQTKYSGPTCVQQLFEEQAEKSPEALAVAYGGEQLTYRQLNEQANQLAHYLRDRGIGPDALVAVQAGRSAGFVVAILGILKAGGAYLPLDTEYPEERLRLILADAEPAILVCSGVTALVPAGRNFRTVDLQRDGAGIAAESTANPGRLNTPENLAYVIYTSGSTGQPKGVCMPHGPLLNLILWQNSHTVCGLGERTLQFAALGFDVCFQEIFSTLSSGGTLVIASQTARKDFVSLVRLIEHMEIHRLFLPFMALDLLAVVAEDTGRPLKSVREVITAGEQLRITPAIRALFHRLTGARLVNQYGPTEAHVVSVFELTGDAAGWPYLPPIGRPISHTQLYILDPDLKPVSAGAAGELFIGGAGVAQGYLKRPELTVEKFVADPFGRLPGKRLYRTGDLARCLPDGNIEFLGRSDDQVKIRGFRVELGEIEAVLATHPGVQRAVVMARTEPPRGQLLVAYLIRRDQLTQPIPDLRSFIQERLPDYMVPAVFIVLPAFPLTQNGKIDRKALPAPQAGQIDSGANYVAPRTAEEQQIAAIWSEVLGLSRIGIHDNFFLIGGDSLRAIKLMLQVEKATGRWIELSTFQLQPTVAGVCAAVSGRLTQPEFQPVVPICPGGNRPPVFCLYNLTGDVNIYYNLAKLLGEDQPVFGIRSPALQNLAQLPGSIEEAAAGVVRCIRQVQPAGAPAIIGYSWAGVLAFEVGRQLAQSEGVESFVASIGPDAPVRPARFILRLTHFIRFSPPWIWRWLIDHGNQGKRLIWWLKKICGLKQSPAATLISQPDWASTPIPRHLLSLLKEYHPAPKSGVPVDIFRERGDYQPLAHPLHAHETSFLPDCGWERWTSRPSRLHWVDGDHESMLKPPFVAGLAQAIRPALDQHFKNHPPQAGQAKRG